MAGPGEAGTRSANYRRLMERPAETRSLVAVAALARIEERGGAMSATAASEQKAQERAMWALGNYHAFATATVWSVGADLVAACGIGAGQRVLDVAAGTGNVAIRAAEAGAQAVAADLTPENFVAGHREAEARGVTVEWVEADAEALPFADGEFDAVLSTFGAIFPPDQQAVADELLRVCRSGGTIGMANFTPEGLGGEFFALFGRYAPPPPPGWSPPVAWGSEERVRELFGDRVSSLELARKEYVERWPGGPVGYVEFFKATFGPAIALYGLLPEKQQAALDADFLAFAARANRAAPGEAAEYPYEYLQVVATKR
jgi:2-polyprenyl-6-hydroxyphenyl methylase/3-demethylubiquinone-9 3-methyltransferase